MIIRVTHRDGRSERRLEIRVAPVRGQVSYFVALHEIGHLVGNGRSGRRLEREAAAWRFALGEALVAPTDATRRRIGKRLRSYVTGRSSGRVAGIHRSFRPHTTRSGSSWRGWSAESHREGAVAPLRSPHVNVSIP